MPRPNPAISPKEKKKKKFLIKITHKNNTTKKGNPFKHTRRNMSNPHINYYDKDYMFSLFNGMSTSMVKGILVEDQ